MNTFLSFLPLIMVTLFILFGGYLIVGHELEEKREFEQKEKLRKESLK